MAGYYLSVGNKILADLDAGEVGVTALPLLATGRAMSLLNVAHVNQLMANTGWSAAETLAAFGLIDARGQDHTALVIAPVGITDVAGVIPGTHRHLIGVGGDYALHQVETTEALLVEIHADLWQRQPVNVLGLLAIVQTFGESFYPTAARDALGMTVEEQLARRAALSGYLAGLGCDTTLLDAASNEHEQVEGVVDALGYTMPQLWNAMG